MYGTCFVTMTAFTLFIALFCLLFLISDRVSIMDLFVWVCFRVIPWQSSWKEAVCSQLLLSTIQSTLNFCRMMCYVCRDLSTAFSCSLQFFTTKISAATERTTKKNINFYLMVSVVFFSLFPICFPSFLANYNEKRAVDA